ncbi:PrsW family glutamic-type intramembrane protease [Leifsonia sp. AG29]|uniref:PrsW family glutamic-type intramembrane protease n=1 Tax=Leifsonia sp. AG29 TaxID=2598860 RepID=UPI001E590976|nr:PrsW family glutamic-type intramembrane protease [Leifsonia sp. AG29]
MTYAPPLTPPSGWYPDPQDARFVRWWSGVQWTAYTYPVVPVQPVRPPRPARRWLGRFGAWIIVAGSAGIWVWLFATGFLLSAIAPPAMHDKVAVLSPFLLLTGAATTALALLYTMSYKLRVDDGLSAPRMLLIGALGGLAATLIAGPVNSLIDVLGGGTATHPSELALLLAGVVEETVKIAAVVLLSLRLPVKDARVGLFVGGAVGLGFSVVENLGYLLEAYARGEAAKGNGLGSFIQVTVMREITGPFLHPVFTAVLAAAVFAGARAGRFRLTVGAVLAFLGVVVAHGGYDGFVGLMDTVSWPAAVRGLLVIAFTLLFMAASGAVWLLVARRIRRTVRPT